MIFSPPLITPRLLLKKESLNDFERFFAMSKDPEVMQYIGDGSIFHWTRNTAFERFKASLGRTNADEFGKLAIYTKEPNRYIGWCEIRYSKFLDHIELGYRYHRDEWFNGYATEAAAAVLSEAYQLSGFDRILACTHPENLAGIRVLEKLGFTYAFSKQSRPAGRDIPVYRMDCKTFEEKH